ncbi:hypothetical protein ALC53_07455, partial [Atta colombica]
YFASFVHHDSLNLESSTNRYLRNAFRTFSEYFQESDNVAMESPKVNTCIIGLVHLTALHCCGGDAEEMPLCVKSSLDPICLSRNKLSTKSGAETNELLTKSKLSNESSWGRYLIRH